MNAKDGSKNVLCFGDSNTWGCVPTGDESRYSPSERWTGILQTRLGDRYEIIEEGLNSRYLSIDDARPGKEGKNAMNYILPCIDSHNPIHRIIVMLGTNEMKARYDLSPSDIKERMEDLMRVIMKRTGADDRSNIILVAPPYVNEGTYYTSERYKGAAQKSRMIGEAYFEIASAYGTSFVDAGPITTVGEDGVHLTKEGHISLADALIPFFSA